MNLLLQANCNIICGPDYGPETRRSMSQLSEKETPIELIEALLKYIESLNISGAVLVFLPGWNLIYTMQKHLEMNPHFGNLTLFSVVQSIVFCFRRYFCQLSLFYSFNNNFGAFLQIAKVNVFYVQTLMVPGKANLGARMI